MKKKILIILVCLGLVFGFYFLNLDYIKASPGTVEFGPEDVILDLTGLDTTTYIASGSKADSLTISGTDLTVYGVWDGLSFVLKTATFTVLQMTPSAGTADFAFSSANVSSGYVSQWTENSSVPVSHTVGVPDANTDYAVKANGVEITGSPFNSGALAEISFTWTGTGAWETYTIGIPTPPPPSACAYHNIWGYAWSENIGWISFSCENNVPLGTGIDYGVNIDPVTGLFSGYAWSENIGWISFEPADLVGCLSGTCNASIDLSTGAISGWAKALAAADGWDGWIGLSGTWADGVSLNSGVGPPSEFEGWAWGDVVVGWVSFNCSNTVVCGVSDYKVMTDIVINSPPYVLPDSANIQNKEYCDFSPIGQVAFKWTYDDNEGDDQAQYNLQVATKDFSDPTFNPAVDIVVDYITNQSIQADSVDPSNSTGTSAVSVKQTLTNPLDIAYGGSYFWRVKVKDTAGKWSTNWEEGPSFSTPSNPYPNPNFDSNPESPPAEVEVDFIDTSICYDPVGAFACSGSGTTNYAWNFNDGSPIDTTKGDTIHTFSFFGVYTVRLEITDTVGVCFYEKELTATLPLPTWKEITPF